MARRRGGTLLPEDAEHKKVQICGNPRNRGYDADHDKPVHNWVEGRQPEQAHALHHALDHAEQLHLKVLEQAGDGFGIDIDVRWEARRRDAGDRVLLVNGVVRENERPQAHVEPTHHTDKPHEP